MYCPPQDGTKKGGYEGVDNIPNSLSSLSWPCHCFRAEKEIQGWRRVLREGNKEGVLQSIIFLNLGKVYSAKAATGLRHLSYFAMV